MPFYNATPLFFAVTTGNMEIANFLIKKEANQEIKAIWLGILLKKECSAKELAIDAGLSTWTLFEVDSVKKIHENRVNDEREYQTNCLPNNVASFFYYSKQQELDAVKAYQSLLEKENSETYFNLQNLKNIHPAVNQGELGGMYRTSLKVRM